MKNNLLKIIFTIILLITFQIGISFAGLAEVEEKLKGVEGWNYEKLFIDSTLINNKNKVDKLKNLKNLSYKKKEEYKNKLGATNTIIANVYEYLYYKIEEILNNSGTNGKYLVNNNKENFSFAYIGDSRDLSDEARKVAKMINNANPDLIIAGGDMWDRRHKGGSAKDDPGVLFPKFISKDIKKNRFWNALGNHERVGNGAASSAEIVPMPSPGHETYTIVQGNTRFFFIDRNDRYNPGKNDPDKEKLLNKEKASVFIDKHINNPRKKWNIVVIHQPLYTVSYRRDKDRTWWLNKYNFDMYLTSHDHAYERFKYKGRTYIVNGIGGAGSRSRSKFNENSDAGKPLSLIAEKYGALFCNVNSNTIKCDLKLTDGTIGDSFILTK